MFAGSRRTWPVRFVAVKALIIDHGLSRSALAGARGLARAGWTVGIGAPKRSLAARSRASSRWHHVPAPELGLDEFVTAVREAIDQGGYDAVLGSDDQHTLALSERRDEIPAAIGYPAHEDVVRSVDKLDLTMAAAAAGLRAPSTAEADAETVAAFDAPIIVKPRIHASFEARHQHAHLEPVLAGSRDEAQEAAAWMVREGGRPLFQERVRGSLMAWSGVLDRDGRLLGCVQQEAERIWPSDVGISVRARTVPLDPALSDGCVSLLRGLNWFGLAELQFIRPEDGRGPMLIDLNGRFYGSLALALAAGVNLPAAWGGVALGAEVAAEPAARVGVRYQWLEGDLRRAYRERRHGRLRDLASTALYALRAKHSVWQVTDPRPGARYAAELAGRATSHLPGR